MKSIDPELVEQLAAVGRAGAPAIPPLLADKNRAWQRLMCGHDPWEAVAERIDDEMLVSLIRGLVLYSQASGWSGGSVSPVSRLYWRAIGRPHIAEPELTSWIVRERRNEYEPFGRMIESYVTTQAEYSQYLAAENRRRAELDRQERVAQVERKEREASVATERLANAVRRGDVAAVTAMLDKGADWQQVVASTGSLVELAAKNARASMVELLKSRNVA